MSSPNLKARLGYSRFRREALDILVLDARYHLVAEVKRALARAGHRVWSLPIADDAESMVRTLLSTLVQHQPDFILSINHHGFDESGSIGALLEAFEIPVAAWYVDSPLFVLRGGPVPAAAVSVVFTWERTLLPLLSRECFASYLPLATDPSLFQGTVRSDADGITFVGDSGRAAQAKWRARLGEDADDAVVAELADHVRRDPARAMHHPGLRSQAHIADRLAAATWRANTAHRAAVLSAFASELTVYGDEGWSGLLDAELRPQVPYGPPLAAVYRDSAVNLNVTSLQMPTAVNQRIFDVPAAGGFLLTDNQADVSELFDEDEVATYQDAEEALDKARYYLKHPTRRAALTERGRLRIAREHTYDHRVKALVRVMHQRFGQSANVRRG